MKTDATRSMEVDPMETKKPAEDENLTLKIDQLEEVALKIVNGMVTPHPTRDVTVVTKLCLDERVKAMARTAPEMPIVQFAEELVVRLIETGKLQAVQFSLGGEVTCTLLFAQGVTVQCTQCGTLCPG